MNRHAILQTIKELGASHCRFVSSGLLLPEERIREYCYENRCGCYGRHLMCPPRTGSIAEATKKFGMFTTGILVQYSRVLDVKKEVAEVTASKRKLHHIILDTETYLKEKAGMVKTFGMIGGECALCETCAGYRGEACVYPDRARPSLEALGVDVIGLLKSLSLDGNFYDDKITWTAMVLMDAHR
jgi:predicted metal-binding protein